MRKTHFLAVLALACAAIFIAPRFTPDVGRPQCNGMSFGNPELEVGLALAVGDHRVFKTAGFTTPEAPGLFCPQEADLKRLRRRGGWFVSDVPDLCGGKMGHADLPEETMIDFNRRMGGSREFQQITGCRTATYCEEHYGRYRQPSPQFVKADPKCPALGIFVASIAAYGAPDQLTSALDGGAALDGQPGDRGELSPVAAASSEGRLDNLRLLAARGAKFKRADVNLISLAIGGQVKGREIIPVLDFLAGQGVRPEDRCAYHIANPLILAVGSPNPEVFQWLLQQGVNLNAVCSRETALTAALQGATRYSEEPSSKPLIDQHLRMAVVLLQKGARLSDLGEWESLTRVRDLRAASIFIAAKRAEGDDQFAISRMLTSASAVRNGKMHAWLISVQQCRKKVTTIRADHVLLCADGPAQR